MKKTACCLFANLLLIVSCLSADIIDDQFNDSSIDADVWAVLTPWSDSSVMETGGFAVLQNRGQLLTQNPVSDSITITGRFRFSGSTHDTFAIYLRSDGTRAQPGGMTFHTGIKVQINLRDGDQDPNQTSNVVISDIGGSQSTTTGFPIQLNVDYDFKIIDMGSTVSLYLNDFDNPLLTLDTINRAGFLIGIQNREGAAAGSSISAGSEVMIDFLVIEDGLLTDTDGDGLSDDFESGLFRYEFVSQEMTWFDAKVLSEARGGHLATVTSQDEWDSIESLLQSEFSGQEFWLGGFESEQTGFWEWATGEPLLFEDWAPGSPNTASHKHMSYLGIGGWDDDNGLNTWPHLFEIGYFTDLNNSDSDADNLSDFEEAAIHGTFPNFADTDDDGLNDGEEVTAYFSNPLNEDSDNDGFSDGVEVAAGKSPTDENSFPAPPVIVEQPVSLEVVAGETAIFNVTAEVEPDLTYQWFFNGGPIINETESQLTLSNVNTFHVGEYYVEVSNGYDTTPSDTVQLTLFLDTDGDGLSDNFENGLTRFKIVIGNWTWHEAKAEAEARGMHLATITSAEEWIRMMPFFGTEFLTGDIHVAIGATDEEVENDWKWVTGEPWGYTNWRSGEPNNGTASNYLELVWADFDGTVGKWNDRGGNLLRQPLRYLFETGFYSDYNNPDTDGDGLNDGDEFNIHGTFPNFADSDQDGLSDSVEIEVELTDPLNPDTDFDGLSDFDEVTVHQTNPLKRDSDEDNLSDYDEIEVYGTLPTVKDSDMDGFNDDTEILAGKDPLNENDFPGAVLNIYQAVELEWFSQQGTTYQIQSSSDLENWQNVGGEIQGDGEVKTDLISIKGQEKQFFRVEVTGD